MSIMLLSGCLKAFTPEKIVKHPDSPMLINKVKGKYIHVSIYDQVFNRMVEYGWVKIDGKEGFTLHKFDWGKYIESKN